MEKAKCFKPKAHILTLLGEELIKSPVMAMYELIKNSYDADAKKVTVQFENVGTPSLTKISILDDGVGMTEDIIENVWLEPGTDYRKPVNEKTGTRQFTYSKYFDRIPMGEKGIGRFAVHKLSNHITIYTRPLVSAHVDKKTMQLINKIIADYEIELAIDWRMFVQKKYLHEMEVKWKIKRNVQEFKLPTTHGTLIVLKDLKEEWTRGMARTLKRNTLSMTSPKIPRELFDIELDFRNNWLEGIPEIIEILQDAPYTFFGSIDENFNLSIDYTFKLNNQEKMGTRRVIHNPQKQNVDYEKINIRAKIESKYRSKLEEDNTDKNEISRLLTDFRSNPSNLGKVTLELFSFDQDSQSLKDTTNKDSLKTILKENAGIRVFKDDLRVYNYGEPGNDWLGLDLERVQNKDNVSNNQNIGFVILEAKKTISLIEKTNREGFIENESYELLKIILGELLVIFKAERFKDREKWLELQKKANKPVEEEFIEIEQMINETDSIQGKLKNNILNKIELLKKSFDKQKNLLLIPAGVGMTASVALHEIEKLVPRMEENIERKPVAVELLKSNVAELKGYVNGIMAILRKSSNSKVKIILAVRKAIDNYMYKMKKRGIDCKTVIDNENLIVNCDMRLMVTMLMNLFDNSIYWLDTTYKQPKVIFIGIKESVKNISLIFADNGPGFHQDDSVNEIVQPFFTRKSDGIGLGLYLIDTIMMKLGKLNIYHNKNELENQNLPDNMTGAIVELIFKKDFKNV